MITLYPHQNRALQETDGLKKVAYYLDMGLGKTYIGSEKMIQLGNNINLIVCQKSKIQDWIEHFKTEHELAEELILDLTNKKQYELFLLETKEINTPCYITDDRTGQRQENLYPYLLFGVINYDLLWRRNELLSLENFTLMLDESSMIQNDKAKRTKFIMKMKAKNIILLSGTPTSGKYENLWTQCRLLGWDISKTAYNQIYINWKKIDVGGFPVWTVDKRNPYKNVKRLKRKIREHGAIFMKTEECFELPEQTFIQVKVNPIKEYKQFMRDGLVNIGDIQLVGDTTLTKRLYLRQLCGQYNENKLDAFKDLIDSTNDRLIVFYNFKAELASLRALVDRPISIINGQKKDLKAYENESNSITFIQYQAGAHGLNLQKANKVIYFTLTEKSELYEQSKKRIHRIGQDKPCFYYVMTCRNSIEEKISAALDQRRDYTEELFKEEYT